MIFSGKKDKQEKTKRVKSNSIETVIGSKTEFEGTIKTKSSLRIDGKLNGKIIAKGDLVVGEKGVLNADVEARNVTVAGSIEGNVITEDKLVIVSSGKLIGDIKISNLIVEDGAIFKGRSESKSAVTKKFSNSNNQKEDEVGNEVKTESKTDDDSEEKKAENKANQDKNKLKSESDNKVVGEKDKKLTKKKIGNSKNK